MMPCDIVTDSQYIVIDNDVNKAGNFVISFLDLELTMDSLPISVTRSYDTLRADEPGDFGCGWVMDLANTRMGIDYGIENPPPNQPFIDGTEVNITLQDGTTYGFTFTPTPETSLFGVPLGDHYPTFTFHELFDRVELFGYGGPYRRTQTGSQTQYLSTITGNPYDSKREEFGGSLTFQLRDQTQYTFDAVTGKLIEMRDIVLARLCRQGVKEITP